MEQPTPKIIVSTDGAVSSAGVEVMHAIAAAAQEAMRAQGDRLEQLILEGHNEVRVKGCGVQDFVYTPPTWKREPIKRARLEWSRRRWRRSTRQQRWGS